MSLKILTVDDSKAVRIIVTKAFKDYDVNILEAADGRQGLEVAGNERPDLILLDVTMPVKSGIEMLTEMKEISILRSIPVIMLTAEAGKDSIMTIAKLGIRDYIVKPFHQNVLIEKVGRVLDLKKRTVDSFKAKTIDDPCTILVVEDKPAIIEQVKRGLEKMPWEVRGVSSSEEAFAFVADKVPEVVIVSLTLPNEEAFSFFASLRDESKTKDLPVFGLAVKMAEKEQKLAQQAGFTGFLSKPIDPADLENKIVSALKLDITSRYFKEEATILVLKLPSDTSEHMLNEVSKTFSKRAIDAVDSGIEQVIFDIQDFPQMEMAVVNFLTDSEKVCKSLTLRYSFIAQEAFSKECATSLAETAEWTFFDSLEAAKKGDPVSA